MIASHLTLENLQRLAAFLQGFPGRKNIIWFAEKVPAVFVTGSDAGGGVASGTAAIGDEIKKTLAMLADCSRGNLSGRCPRNLNQRPLYGGKQPVARSSQATAGVKRLQRDGGGPMERNTDQLECDRYWPSSRAEKRSRTPTGSRT